MKHKEYIDKFISNRHEFDGYCHIFWLPSNEFNGILPEPRPDMLGAYLDPEDGYRLSFLLSSEDDRDQIMASFGELPYHVQKELVLYFRQYEREKPEPKFKVGNVVSVHFDDPQSIGYNGTCHRIVSMEWFNPWGAWRYCLKSINGTGYIFTRESEMTFQTERYTEPYFGQCIIEVGD